MLEAKVLVIGAGGLGCPALQYLAAAGTGIIGIVDDDVVALSNLHRQLLFHTGDIGFSKAIKAKEALLQLNPTIQIVAYNERLTTENALLIFAAYDIIIDGTDNFATRYLVNDACVLLGKPLVYGAVSQFEGQVAVFNCMDKDGNSTANYRDLFPSPPKEGDVLNCAEAGVLGVLPGIIGTMQANETMKLITGIGKPLSNAIFTYNALSNKVYTVSLLAKAATRLLVPADEVAFKKMDYEWLCRSELLQPEIDVIQFNEMLDDPSVDIVDVREYDEQPMITGFIHSKIPLGQFKQAMPEFEKDTIIVFCQSGKRSMQAAQWLFDSFGSSKKIYSLKGGILSWINSRQTSPNV